MPAADQLRHALDYADRWLAYRRWRLDIPGIQAAVRVDGELLLDTAHGVADASTREALTPRHRFRIASHSKALAAIVAMRLVDDGREWGMAARSFEPDRWLVGGDTVIVGELTLEVIHCPGHTPGHVVFFHRPSKFAIVGDVLFQGSIGRTDFPMGNHQDLIDAITQKLWPLGEDVTFIPGHGPTSTFGHERKTNAFVSDAALA